MGKTEFCLSFIVHLLTRTEVTLKPPDIYSCLECQLKWWTLRDFLEGVLSEKQWERLAVLLEEVKGHPVLEKERGRWYVGHCVPVKIFFNTLFVLLEEKTGA